MNTLHHTATPDIALVSWTWISPNDLETAPATEVFSPLQPPTQKGFDFFKPLRRWLDGVEVKDVAIAHRICKAVPSQCPFERDINLFGKTLFHIPPMCKLNPLYEEVVALRFRALCYLADECGEDVTQYC